MSFNPLSLPNLPLEMPHIDPSIVYHYASLETLTKIVDTQQLWATNVKFLNDTKERAAFLEQAMQRLEGFRDRNPNLDRTAFDEALDPDRPAYDSISYLPSVISFSKDADSLPQWRAYCPKGRGVAIGFSVSALKNARVNENPNATGFAWMLFAPRGFDLEKWNT